MSKKQKFSVTELEQYFIDETGKFPGKTAWLYACPDRDDVYWGKDEEVQVVSASTIKVPVMMALFKKLEEEKLPLSTLLMVREDQILDDSLVFEYGSRAASFYELVVWMIVNSDNTATNVILDYMGFDYINRYCKEIALRNTKTERRMLDFKAVDRGLNNYISPADFYRCILLLWKNRTADPKAALALDILKRNRDFDSLCRYLYEGPVVAHKSGGLDDIVHDAGLFYTEQGSYFLGVFISAFEPSPENEKNAQRLIGRLSRKVYDFESGR